LLFVICCLLLLFGIILIVNNKKQHSFKKKNEAGPLDAAGDLVAKGWLRPVGVDGTWFPRHRVHPGSTDCVVCVYRCLRSVGLLGSCKLLKPNSQSIDVLYPVSIISYWV
jgi:hypothetical protein